MNREPVQTIEEQQRERANQKEAAIRGLRDLLAAIEADEKCYCVMTCHGRAKDDYGIERDQWAIDVVWRRAAALYRAPVADAGGETGEGKAGH